MSLRFPSLLLFLLFFAQLRAQQTVISENNLRRNITYLASDSLKGRGTGTPEERLAALFIADQFEAAGLAPKGDNGTWFHHFGFHKADPHGNIDKGSPTVYSQNVAAWIDNGATNTIIIGAHYDHLGLGYDHNSLEANSEGKIHNGADDNASGTSGVIELARYFANNGVQEKHNFLFLCFSGEELGLVGSKKFTEFPSIDLSSVSLMINLDMIGRLNTEKKLVIGGVGTAPDFVPLFNELNHKDLGFKLDSAGIGPSDHTSFYLKNIPVLFFFTGQHSDYHKPSDDAEKVNFDGEKQILELIVKVVDRLDKTPKLTFQETKSKKEDTPSFKVTLGIMPDYTWEGEGVHVDGVTDGRPASVAGILKGDIITGLGEYPIKNIQDYMKALSKFAKGNSTTVRVLRGKEEKTMNVTF